MGTHHTSAQQLDTDQHTLACRRIDGVATNEFTLCVVKRNCPRQAGFGGLVSGALEMSNVDLSQEFTNLIIAQRGFQANARIITTSDEVLQELTQLKR